MLEHLVRRLAATALEAGLHRPDVAHVCCDAPLQRQLLGLAIEHIVCGLVQRRDGRLAGGLVGAPFFQHLVPQQRCEQEARRHRLALFNAQVGVVERQAHEALAQRLLHHHVEQRQQAMVQAFAAQPFEAGHGLAAHQQLQHFVEDARRRHVVDQRRHHGNRRLRRRVDVETELGGEAHHPQHAHRIFAVALLGHADDAQRAPADVGHAAVIVQHQLRRRVVIHRVDGEVAPQRILVLFAEGVVAQYAAVLVLGRRFHRRAAEGGDFEQVLAEHHVHDLEAAADDEGAPEQPLDFFRRRIGGNVEVLGLDAQQQVAHRAADQEGLETGFLQGLRHTDRVVRYQRGIDAMLLRAVHHRLGGVGLFVRLAEDAPYEFFNH